MKKYLHDANTKYYAGPVKWISKWRGHGTLKSIVGHLVANKKYFRILDALEWLKQYFDLGDSLLIVSALKPFLFLPLSPFCLFAMQKGGGAMPPPPGPPGIASRVMFRIYVINFPICELSILLNVL